MLCHITISTGYVRTLLFIIDNSFILHTFSQSVSQDRRLIGRQLGAQVLIELPQVCSDARKRHLAPINRVASAIPTRAASEEFDAFITNTITITITITTIIQLDSGSSRLGLKFRC
jgi:hypothetical protein